MPINVASLAGSIRAPIWADPALFALMSGVAPNAAEKAPAVKPIEASDFEGWRSNYDGYRPPRMVQSSGSGQLVNLRL